MERCPRCYASCEDFVVLADHLGGQKLCDACFRQLVPLMEFNRIKWEEKQMKAERKILKRFMKYNPYNGCLWYFFGFIFLIIILIILNSG